MTFIAALLLATQTLSVESSRAVQDAPVSCSVDVDPSKPWKLIRVDGGSEVPVQFNGKTAHWIASGVLEAGAKREYRLEPGKSGKHAGVEVDYPKGILKLRVGEKMLLRYNVAKVYPPEPYDKLYARGAFIHPIWTPGGKVVSNQFAVHHHLHQNGLWLAWRSSVFEGRKLSFWDPKAKNAEVRTQEVDQLFSGPVFGGFRALHEWVDTSAPGGEKTAVKETWDVRAYACGDVFVFDLTSTQACATDSPISHDRVHYGGLAFRGSKDWEETMDFLTSEGKTRKNGNETRARWVVALGKVDGGKAQIGFLSHPENFRAPQPVRLHPKMPYFCFAPTQQGKFSIEPGEPLVLRYRMIVKDGVLSSEEMNRRWNAFAFPPSVRTAK